MILLENNVFRGLDKLTLVKLRFFVLGQFSLFFQLPQKWFLPQKGARGT
jgi:hypothetical protein